MLYTSRGNDVIGTGESCRSSYYSLSAYQLATGRGQGSVQADPQFVNPIADFHLKSSSPAIDAGVDIGVNKDIDGNARVQGAGFDMGVYENKNGVLPSTSTPIMATVTATIEPVVPTATSYRPTATAMETAQEPTQTVDVQPTPTAEMTNVPATETLLPVTLTPTAIIDFPTPTVTEVVIQPTATPTAIINLPFPTATELVVQPTATISPLPASSTPTESSVLASPTPTQATTRKPREETIYDDKDKAFSYSVGWRSVKNKRAYGGSLKVTTRNEASVKLNFTGQSFSVLYKGGKAFGKMDIYVDGKFVGTINQQQKAAFQSRWDYPGQLAFGNHTLKLIFVTNKRAKDRVRGSLDAVIVH